MKNLTHIIPFKNLRLFMRALLPLIKEGVHLALFKRVKTSDLVLFVKLFMQNVFLFRKMYYVLMMKAIRSCKSKIGV